MFARREWISSGHWLPGSSRAATLAMTRAADWRATCTCTTRTAFDARSPGIHVNTHHAEAQASSSAEGGDHKLALRAGSNRHQRACQLSVFLPIRDTKVCVSSYRVSAGKGEQASHLGSKSSKEDLLDLLFRRNGKRAPARSKLFLLEKSASECLEATKQSAKGYSKDYGLPVSQQLQHSRRS